MTASVINSSKRNPCPVCGRTKDRDCRQMPNGTVLCHHPRNLKPGTVITGEDGQQWAFTRNSSDGERGAVFTLDKPLEKRQRTHLRVVSSGVSDATATAVPASLPALPDPATFFLARFSPEHQLDGSWHEGEFWHYNSSHRQQRKGTGKKKKIYAHHKNAEGVWLTKGSSACPCWNESLISPELDGTPVFTEGEPCADALCQAGILGVSLPGHLATNLEHCTAALKRHKQAGLKLVACLADNDDQGRKKAALMAQAALEAGLPFIGINAGTVWPDLAAGGSVDDLGHLEPDELIGVLDQAFRDELANKHSSPKGNEALASGAETKDSALDAGSVLALDREVDEKQAALSRLVDQLVDARKTGNTVRDAALMGATWRLGTPSTTTDGLVLQRWAELRGIATETAVAPVVGRIIGQTAPAEGLEQRLPGFLLENGLHLLIADAGTGKTTMSLEMARLLANGGSGFLDQQEGPTKKGKVLYLGTDGGAGAFNMLSDYATDLAEADQWANVEFWCEEAGKRKPWVLTLYNLELLASRLEQGDIKAVFIDTINSVFQGAGISPYLGPVDQYLRLLKAIVCPYGPLIMLGHTNRSGAGIKGIAGSPAFQEVPDALHRIERLKQPQEDGTLIFRWTVEKFRGESFRQFSYARIDNEFKVVEGHYFTNCGDKVLAAIQARKALKDPTSPKYLAQDTKEAPASVRSALTRLRQRGLIEKQGTGFRLTPAGEQRLAAIKL
jgi:hypothetical protein